MTCDIGPATLGADKYKWLVKLKLESVLATVTVKAQIIEGVGGGGEFLRPQVTYRCQWA